MAEVLVVGKKISEMDLVTDIVGDEKIPTGVVGDKAVTTGQLLTYVNNNGVAQWGRIGGDITNQADLQNQFTQERDALKGYTQEQFSQQQVALQEHIDATNEAFEYARDNGSALPYKEGTSYDEGAIVVKDGILQQWKGGVWKSVISDGLSDTIQTFNTPEAGVDPVTGVAEGAYFNVRSSSDESYIEEYQNIGGVPTPSGKSYPSSEYVRAVKEVIIDPETGEATTSKVIDQLLRKSQEQINAFQKSNLKLFGENVGGGGDDSQAFIDVNAVDKNYYVPNGVYRVNSSLVDVNTHNFSSGGDVTIIIDGVSKDYSNATNGAFRAVNNGNFNFWYNAKSGATIARWSNGVSASDSHQFYLPLEVRRNGHGFMLRQATAGAGIDILYQDHLSDDMFYMYANGTVQDCKWGLMFDTTPNGTSSGGFDDAIQLNNVAGVATLRFPAAALVVNQGVSLNRRSGHTRRYNFFTPTDASLVLRVYDETNNLLRTPLIINDNGIDINGKVILNTGYVLPPKVRQKYEYFEGGALASGASKTLRLKAHTDEFAFGSVKVGVILSDGTTYFYFADFAIKNNVGTLTPTAMSDTIPNMGFNINPSSGASDFVISNGLASLRFTIDIQWSVGYY